MWSFLVRFARHGTRRAWDRTMAALTPIDLKALEAFDELAAGGVEAPTHAGPFVIAFRDAKHARGFLREIDGVIRHGQSLDFEPLAEPRSLAPQLAEHVGAAYRLDGQRFVEPGPYVESLASSVRERGGTIVGDALVTGLDDDGSRPAVVLADGSRRSADVVVLATGAWLSTLARQVGVRVPVQAGRGYSFSVATARPGVFVAGGHGMWGFVLGPATGRALAERIVTGTTPREIAPFDPLRPRGVSARARAGQPSRRRASRAAEPGPRAPR